MELKFSLRNGASFSAVIPDYNAEALTANLNDPKQYIVQIGDIVIAKNMISLVSPVQPPEGANVQIFLQNGETVNEYIEAYNAAAIAERANNQQNMVFAIGNTIVSKNLFGYITPI